MARIHILSEEVASKVAAGEVVERPASVLKELIENSLDGGATRIDIELENGGLTRLSVRDNGEGILTEDLPMTIIRHATSKIRSADDLFAISSMGFRGEALASIASVSRLTILTQTEDEAGAKLQVLDESDFLNPKISPWIGMRGTTVIMEDLFYNVPARLNFLKKSTSETAACTELVQHLMLSHPSVSFYLKNGGKEVISGPGIAAHSPEETMRLRAGQIMDDVSQLLFTEEQTDFGKVQALISPPGVDRATTRHVFTFINGRLVKDKTIRFAIQRGYHGHLLKGRQPVVYIQLELNPSLVDVNAHPAKTEVRFQYPEEVQALISMAIRKILRTGNWASPNISQESSQGSSQGSLQGSLQGSSQGSLQGSSQGSLQGSSQASSKGNFSTSTQYDGTSPTIYSRDDRAFAQSSTAKPQRFMPDFDLATSGRQSIHQSKPNQNTRVKIDSFDGNPAMENQTFSPAIFQSPSFTTEEFRAYATSPSESKFESIPWAELEYIGAFAKCYLMFEWNKKLLMIDQHAFHERVIFERLSKNAKMLLISQPMMIPEVYTLSPEEAQNLEKNQSRLRDIGFNLNIWPEGTVEILAIPALLIHANKESLLAELAEKTWVDHDLNEAADISASVLETIACHSAVRSGEELTENHLADLITQAQQVDFYHNCPHGRRVFRWFERHEIGRWFDRL